MKIILDTDGTMTDFNLFIEENAIPYFEKKYGMYVVNPSALEVEDILDMDNFFSVKYGIDLQEAKKYTKKALDDFWISTKFIKFSLFGKFRKGTKEWICDAIKKGHIVEVHTSRSKTCENSAIGTIARTFTFLQYRINGISIPFKRFFFYPDDESKVEGIKKSKPDLVFDDKPEILEQLSTDGIKCICVEGNHNATLENTDMIQKIHTFYKEELEEKLKILMGVKTLRYYERAAHSDILFNKMKVLRFAIGTYFKPIVLNRENLFIPNNEGIIYAPNHRSTLDPIAISGIIAENVHWAALLRFFEGKDSIFNNSKNPVLCKLTASTFKGLEYFPIDRKSDNPAANNFKALTDMVNFLKINQKIGIFPEGTTRRPEGQEFGTFDDSFVLLSKKTNSWIQPITTLWIRELGIPQKLIINFGVPFKVGDMTREEAMTHYLAIQSDNLKENYAMKESLEKQKTLSKK